MRILLTACILFFSLSAFGDIEIYRHAPKSDSDQRFRWFEKLLSISLDKTVDQFGPYTLKFTPKMNRERQIETAKLNKYKNFIYLDIYSEESSSEKGVTYIPFPIELGMLGYRICFHAKSKQTLVSDKVRNQQIRQLRVGQGKGWIDVGILRYNGFNVFEALDYDNLFHMTAAGRFDLFCRGVNEIYDEYHHHAAAKDLKIESQIALYYALPNFIFTNENNKKLISRLSQGLDKAFKDGSIPSMFQDYYGKRIDFVKLRQRKIIALDNPYLRGLDKNYEAYTYKLNQ